MPGAFYQQLEDVEALLIDKLEIEVMGSGVIRVNDVYVDTNEQAGMLTPAFFEEHASDYQAVQQFKTFFENMRILPVRMRHAQGMPHIQLRPQVMAKADRPQPEVLLDDEILEKQWRQLFPKEIDDLKRVLRLHYLRLGTKAAGELPPMLSEFALKFSQAKSRSKADISEAIEETLNDPDNIKAIAKKLKPNLKARDKITFSISGAEGQFSLVLDRSAGKIYGIDDTVSGDSPLLFIKNQMNVFYQWMYGIKETPNANLLFLKTQIEDFLKSISDDTDYQFQLLGEKSRQPDKTAYVSQMGGVSQFLHYAALSSGVKVDDLRKEVPPRATTLMYLLQHAVMQQDEALLAVLNTLGRSLNQTMAEAIKSQHQYIVTGRDNVDGLIQAILEVAEDTAEEEQKNGTYDGDTQDHKDVGVVRLLRLAFHNHLNAVERGSEALEYAQNSILQHIALARFNLQNKHQYSGFLENIITCVSRLGVVPVVKRLLTGQWDTFRSKQGWDLDDLEQETKNLGSDNPPPKR